MKSRPQYKDTVYSDVDETLVRWCKATPGLENHPNKFKVIDPLDDEIIELVPVISTIKKLRELHGQGYKIVIWSFGGKPWAETVARALGLMDLQPTILCKPVLMFDDFSPAYNFNDSWVEVKPEAE